jgi:hypothetical protein
MSCNVLLAHEDKTADGAPVASLSIPWRRTVADLDAGYPIVWARTCANTRSRCWPPALRTHRFCSRGIAIIG